MTIGTFLSISTKALEKLIPSDKNNNKIGHQTAKLLMLKIFKMWMK